MKGLNQSGFLPLKILSINTCENNGAVMPTMADSNPVTKIKKAAAHVFFKRRLTKPIIEGREPPR